MRSDRELLICALERLRHHDTCSEFSGCTTAALAYEIERALNAPPLDTDFAWLEDKLNVDDGYRGPWAEIRFQLLADPEAELPSLRELIKRAREDEKAQADEAADRGGD